MSKTMRGQLSRPSHLLLAFHFAGSSEREMNGGVVCGVVGKGGASERRVLVGVYASGTVGVVVGSVFEAGLGWC
jgi:hypothetical protein